jgi:hypothetical protein
VKDVTHRETELLFWMLPRGLVTAVLALEILSTRGAVFGFLPAMAFTVVLVTNLFVVAGAVRAAKASTLVTASAGVPQITEESELRTVGAPRAIEASASGQGEK